MIICISCSGIHRQLGTHISRVRSTTLDAWDRESQRLLLATGNAVAKTVYEAQMTETQTHLGPESTQEERLSWIKRKYIEKEFLSVLERPDGVTLEKMLPIAILEGDIVATLDLIARGVNINWKNSDNLDLAALHLAVTEGQTTICDLLLQNGAQPDLADGSGWTPLHHSAYLDKVNCVILLIRRGAKLSLLDNQAKTPLQVAVANERAHCVTLLRLAEHAESQSGNPLEDEHFAIALREFSAEVEEMLAPKSNDAKGLWTGDSDSEEEAPTDASKQE